ncbi:MAG: hypothetical protein WDM88_00790 [Galbitalea sp.]
MVALERVSTAVRDYRALNESTLLEVTRIASASRRLVESHLALVAGEVAHRSRPELGHEGLAYRSGLRTPEQFVRVTTGSTGRDAVTAVRVGVLMGEAATGAGAGAGAGAATEPHPSSGEPLVPQRPWLTAVADALAARGLSVGQAEAIRSGLGEPTSGVSAEQLADAVLQLVGVAAETGMDPDGLARRGTGVP